MDERTDRIAALANAATYNSAPTAVYIDGAPHLKHESLRRLFAGLVMEVFETARIHSSAPRVLDLGAGEGSATLPFLELGARVVAVDVSDSQLTALAQRCWTFGDRLTIRCDDAAQALANGGETYDVIVANSFLHHIPDYPGLIRHALTRLGPHGQFFSFQDPLRYDTVGTTTRLFGHGAFLFWRIFKGDVIGGLRRRFRRARGIYLEDSVHDNAEYHVTRNGVDQEAIRRLFAEEGFDCRVVSYFSTQSRLFQPLGAALGMKNTFAVLARRKK